MLYPINPLLLDAIKKEKTEQFIRQAEAARLANQYEMARPNWLYLPGRQRIERLAHQLIAWGGRVERLGTKPSV